MVDGKPLLYLQRFSRKKDAGFSLYPVMDTLDRYSSIYFEAVEHQGVKDHVGTLDVTGAVRQFAFDFV